MVTIDGHVGCSAGAMANTQQLGPPCRAYRRGPGCIQGAAVAGIVSARTKRETSLCSGQTIRSHLARSEWSANHAAGPRVSHCGRGFIQCTSTLQRIISSPLALSSEHQSPSSLQTPANNSTRPPVLPAAVAATAGSCRSPADCLSMHGSQIC